MDWEELENMAGRCPHCNQQHEPHEDAACGCGCGSEPMGCKDCSGPMTKKDYEKLFRNGLVEDRGEHYGYGNA